MLKAPMRGKFLGFLDGKAVIAQGNKLARLNAWEDAEKVFRGNQYRNFHLVIGVNSDGAFIVEADLLEEAKEEEVDT